MQTTPLKTSLIVNGVDQTELLASGDLTLRLMPNGDIQIAPAR